MREESVVLKDHAEAATFGGEVCDIGVLKFDGSGVGFLETGNHAQGRSLAAAGWSKQSEELALVDVKRDAGDRVRRSKGTGEIF
jgi:hypothetical protein